MYELDQKYLKSAFVQGIVDVKSKIAGYFGGGGHGKSFWSYYDRYAV